MILSSSNASTLTSPFSEGEIYVTAFFSTALDSFHYALSIMMDPFQCKMLHARELWPDHFVFEDKENSLTSSATLCIALKIGDMRYDTLEQVTALLQAIPMALPNGATDQRFDCRVWLKEAIKVLNNQGVLRCADADMLIDWELTGYATYNKENIMGGFGPFRRHVSMLSA
ncbi:hypothetical protein IW261DRAFT_1636312 [Armillaria novae-zelandiae]|uniref:Uncharacterized protein n=1 Tax=Armillaria novae-zelandiae TaxID=153914 RepID=A0AA39N7C4_9AGAR|nr:hypothetical protein IW261DRAFT_1636312 [Armillaria novae-zelandiae]